MGGWHPWRALRARANTALVWRPIEGAGALAEVRVDGSERIILDPGLTRIERNAALAHELIHLERGVPHVDAPELLVAKEEHAVRDETAQRLIPPAELRAWVAARCEIEAVTAALVAEEWEVPLHVARRALSRMRHPTALPTSCEVPE